MTVANPVRGEVTLRLASREFMLRPTFDRLVAAEGELGSLFLLLDRAAAGDVRVGEVEALFWTCLDGAVPGREEFRLLLAEAGLSLLLPPYRQLLAQLFGGR